MPQAVRRSTKQTVSWASSTGQAIPDRRPMSVREFRRLCEQLEIEDCVTAAKAFGLSWRNCQRYYYEETPVPGPLARLLRLAIKTNTSLKDLRAL